MVFKKDLIKLKNKTKQNKTKYTQFAKTLKI